MSIEAGVPWTSHGLKFHGMSLSGIRTCIALSELSFAWDVAQGYPFSLNLKHFFLSHGHLDHSAGVPYIISQKALTRQAAGRFYMPSSLVEPLDQIMKLWEKIEEHQYSYEFLPVKSGDRVVLNEHFFMKVFPTVHRIESYGYTLYEKRKKLAPAFQSLPPGEVAKRSRAGENVNIVQEIPLASFTGDTQIDFLDRQGGSEAAAAKILFVECTYMDQKKSVADAREWGHLHLEELIPRLPDIKAEKIVLIHLSSRYSLPYAQEILRARLPKNEQERVVLFPGR